MVSKKRSSIIFQLVLMARKFHGPIKWLALSKKAGTPDTIRCHSLSPSLLSVFSEQAPFMGFISWSRGAFCLFSGVMQQDHVLVQPFAACPLGTCPAQMPQLWPGIHDMRPGVSTSYGHTGAAGKPHLEFMTWDWGRRNAQKERDCCQKNEE